MPRIASALILVAGLIHLLPLPGVLGAAHLARLYGVAVDDADLLILLRHRALLFAALGVFLIAAAFHPPWRLPACLLGLASALSFIVVALQQGGYNAAIQRVVLADVVAVGCLLAALAIGWRSGAP